MTQLPPEPPGYPTPQDPYQPQAPYTHAAPDPTQPNWSNPYAQPGPVKQGTNGFAIASLVFGIIGGILLSVIFGFVALSQIKKTGQQGRGMAIAGLILSAVWALVICGIIAVAVIIGVNDAKNDTGLTTPTTRTTTAGSTKVESLRIGDCVNDLKEDTKIMRLPTVACSTPHEGEVFAIVNVPGTTYPGEDAIFNLADEKCFDALEGYSAKAADDPDIGVFYLYPTSSSWSSGDRSITCIANSDAGKLTGSLKD